MTEGIDQFGMDLMRLVRDPAIAGCDSHLQPDAWAPTGRQWRASVDEAHEETAVAALRYAIPDIVDEVRFRLLMALDADELKLSFRNVEGEVHDLTESGELAGWFAMSRDEGWKQYSEGRVNPEA